MEKGLGLSFTTIDCTPLGRMEYIKNNRIRQEKVSNYLDEKLFEELKRYERSFQTTFMYKIKQFFKVGI